MDTVLITGTTSGIGAAFAEKFAREGNNLILVSRNADKLRRQQADLQSRYHVSIEYISCDLAEDGVAELITEKIRQLGLLVDVLINNAGFNEVGYFTDTHLSKELNMIQVHIKVLTSLTKLFLPGMIDRGHGRILNVGSTGAYMPCPCDTVYAATKAYVLSFSNGLYQELKGTGVTVTCLCPGATQTLFASKANIDNTLLFKFFVMQPEDVASIGYKSLMKGKRTTTAGLYNKLLVLSSKLLPISIINPIAQWMFKE
ncbi:MAG: SDR family oxidoreductase [Lachnospiraceae bacterium]|nr:SDR family oxidoreductase [Lachnospiraceae bacterium]